MAAEKEIDTPVLHVIVVGFHHKKGCQVEYSYPPVIAGNPVDSHELPEEWKHLPSLALPDGAHNLSERHASKRTVYCVSCYRQMDAKDLLNRTADITRSTVQKSVCVVSRLPLYGLLKAKLELITHAYFDERDFSKVELLEQTFNNLNASLTESLLNGTQVFLSLSPREAVVRFKHKLMVLFKLLLLERRVLFFGSPVEMLGTTILSVLSLYPGMLEFGLDQAVSDERRLVSPTMGLASLDPGDGGTGEEFVEVRYHQSPEEEKTDVRSELSELLPFVHNSPVMSEPPESPTIPRDVAFSTPASDQAVDASMVKARKEAENRQRRISGSSWSSTDSDRHSAPSAALSASGLEVHKPNHHLEKGRHGGLKIRGPQARQNSSGSGGQSAESEVNHRTDPTEVAASPSAHSPLEDVSSLTQISAVQMGRMLPNQQEAMEDYIHEVELRGEGAREGQGGLTLSVETSDPLLGRSDSVEELDSPESISKIDREDCFSWEEDRLQLSLAVDTEDSSAVDDHSSPDTAPEEQGSSLAQSQPTEQEPSASGDPKGSSSNKASPAKSSPASAKKARSKRNSPPEENSPARKTAGLKNKLSTAFGKVRSKSKDTGAVEMKPLMKGEVSLQQDDFGFPLAIFTKGCVCHPYLSLQFHSILNDVNVRSFVLGATNILFRQQKQVTDVIVEVEEGKLEIKDRELQKQLHLTTADLRFSELLVRQVTEERSNVYLDNTEWEGSDEWIRAQFRSYLQSLLATMQTEDGKLLEDFGLPFISAWRTTHNYRHWLDTLPHPKMADVPAGHPFQGNLSVTDVRMRLNHSMQSTERGRKINAAVLQTGKYVMQTGKVVGGAFSSARSAVSSWFTSIAKDWQHEEEEEEAAGREEATGKEATGRDDATGKEEGDEAKDTARENAIRNGTPPTS